MTLGGRRRTALWISRQNELHKITKAHCPKWLLLSFIFPLQKIAVQLSSKKPRSLSLENDLRIGRIDTAVFCIPYLLALAFTMQPTVPN